MRKLSKGEGISFGLAVIVVLGSFLFGNSLFSFFAPEPETATLPAQVTGESLGLEDIAQPTPTGITTTNTPKPTTMNGLTITDERVGTGAEAVPGRTITVNYKGTFQDGSKFDSSYDRGEPFTFALGGGQVIAGWDQGFAGMKVGGKRKIVVPPALGYGPNDYGPIPGNSTLIFEVELLDVK